MKCFILSCYSEGNVQSRHIGGGGCKIPLTGKLNSTGSKFSDRPGVLKQLRISIYLSSNLDSFRAA